MREHHNTTRIRIAVATAALGLALSGCSDAEDTQPVASAPPTSAHSPHEADNPSGADPASVTPGKGTTGSSITVAEWRGEFQGGSGLGAVEKPTHDFDLFVDGDRMSFEQASQVVSFFDAQLSFVRCIRSHSALTRFPDPLPSGHLNWAKLAELGMDGSRGKPHFEDEMSESHDGRPAGPARTACLPLYLLATELTPPVDQAKLFDALIKHAKCMRDHGVESFLDPTMRDGNVQPGGFAMGSTTKDGAAAAKEARPACDADVPGEFQGMQ